MPENLADILKTSKLEVTFTKLNGEKRVMLCTLKEDLLPPVELDKESTRSHSDDVQVVYDLEKNAWRSFRQDSVISYRLKG